MRKSNLNENGRSMIEMLGVLAIIGVLSVGGIAGYSKAMMKYRINKTIEQITLISQNIRTFFSSQVNYLGVHCRCDNGSCRGQSNNDGCPIIKKAKILPDEMLTLASDGKITAITSEFDGMVDLNPTTHTFGIVLYEIPQEACIDLATKNWGTTSSNFVFLGINQGVENSGDKCVEWSNDYGAVLCGKGNDNDIALAIKGCFLSNNQMLFVFK